MSDIEEIAQMICDCLNRESKLSDWEVGFIASISDAIDSGRRLTENQDAKLTEIWERVTV